MKLYYSPSIVFLYDVECYVDVSLDWDGCSSSLVIDDVLDSSGTHSMMFHKDERMKELARWIADAAEDDDDLLSRAIEHAQDEMEFA